MGCEGFGEVEDKNGGGGGGGGGVECEGNCGSKECNCRARRLGKGRSFYA